MANLFNQPSVLGNAIRQAAATAETAAFGAAFAVEHVSTGVDTVPAPLFGQRAELRIQGQGTAALTVPSGYSAILNQADTQTIDVGGVAELSYEGAIAGQSLATADFAGGTIAMAGGGNTVLSEASFNDNLIVAGIVDTGAPSYALTAAAKAGENSISLGIGAATVAAGLGKNIIFTEAGHDLIASEGADTIVAGSGTTAVVASGTGTLVFEGAGQMSFVNGGGAATVVGDAGSGTISGGTGSLVVFGDVGSNVVYGGSAGGNIMFSGIGATTLIGGGAYDQLYAKDASDVLAASGGQTTLSAAGSYSGNLLFGGSGNDLMVAGAGHDTMVAGSGTATIFGTNGNGATTNMFAGIGNGEFVAGSGQEFIQGGAGTWNVFEGAGHAEFGLSRGSAGGTLNVYGFKPGRDVFHLTGYGAADPLARETASGPSTGFTLSDNTHVTLVDATGLTAASFV